MSATREARARRAARREGLALKKYRGSHPYLIGTYMLVDPATNMIECGSPSTGYGMSLDEIEAVLFTYNDLRRAAPEAVSA